MHPYLYIVHAFAYITCMHLLWTCNIDIYRVCCMVHCQVVIACMNYLSLFCSLILFNSGSSSPIMYSCIGSLGNLLPSRSCSRYAPQEEPGSGHQGPLSDQWKNGCQRRSTYMYTVYPIMMNYPIYTIYSVQLILMTPSIISCSWCMHIYICGLYACIYTCNPNRPLFLKVNPQNKAFSNQNKGHLGSRYIYIPNISIRYISCIYRVAQTNRHVWFISPFIRSVKRCDVFKKLHRRPKLKLSRNTTRIPGLLHQVYLGPTQRVRLTQFVFGVLDWPPRKDQGWPCYVRRWT